MIEDFFLQASTDTSADLAWIAILIAGISAIGITGSFLLNWRVTSKENDRKYAELVSKYINELNELEDKRHIVKTTDEKVSHVTKELNKVEEIVFLNSKGKIPYDLTIYFEQWIQEAYTMLEIMDGKNIDGKIIYKKHWKHLIAWCKKHNIQQTKYIPTPVVNLSDFLKKPKESKKTEK